MSEELPPSRLNASTPTSTSLDEPGQSATPLVDAESPERQASSDHDEDGR